MKKIFFYTTILLLTFSCTKLDEEIFDSIPEDQFPENEAQAALAVVPTYQELADLIDDAGWWFWAQGGLLGVAHAQVHDRAREIRAS